MLFNTSRDRRFGFVWLGLLVVSLSLAGGARHANADESDPSGMTEAAADLAESGTPITLESLTRTHVTGLIYHYKAVIRVGEGPYDTIGLHRVVREIVPFHPVSSAHGVMLLHGDISTFQTSFLLTAHSTAVPANQALAVYLAQNGVDVWGVDRRWTFVPATATDFSSLASQGFGVAISDTRLALALARRSRYRSGSGLGRMILGGWSRGGEISYAVANDEAVRPLWQRHVKGLIPIDVPIRYAPEDEGIRAAVCLSYANSKAQYDLGFYEDPTGGTANLVASLDISAPSSPSPLLPGFTNHQVALVLMAQSFVLSDPTPWFHFAAGTFDGSGIPNGLQYSTFNYVRSWFENAPPFQARLETLDGYALVCESPSLPYDDNLGLITVPTLYMGAAGGFGVAGIYSTTLLGSTDVTTQVIRLHPVGDETLDFGHADLMYANNAQTLAWSPILSWILAH